MSILTGDRYLASLHRFLTLHAASLLDAALTLKLNPVGLHYLHSRLDELHSLHAVAATAPLDYLRAYVADLGDHRALEQLRRILKLLPALKVFSALPGPDRDPTPVSLLAFARLRVLELRGCDLSTAEARGLVELRGTLEKLICHNSTDALKHVFASRIVDIKEAPVWSRLTFVSCACNGLEFMDESLKLLPVAETLDLSHNRFAKVDNLRKCTKLKHLDLEFNHLRTISCLSEVSCQLVKLVLRNNALTTLRGLENMKSVEGLDLSYNIISSFSELEVLANLPALQSLWLEGNPICCARWYRAHVFSFFSDPEKLKLDEKEISTREHWERFIIFAKRQERPAGNGIYFPAKGDAEDEGSTDKKKKKQSRIAIIDDDEHRRIFCSSLEDQESASCDDESWRKDEKTISDGDLKVGSLRKRVERMKKESSVLWLREFKEWLEQNSEGIMDGGQCMGMNLRPVEELHTNQSKVQKRLVERSSNVTDTSHVSEDKNSSHILESDMSFQDTYAGGQQNEYTNDKDSSEIPVLNGGDVRALHSEQGILKIHSMVLQNLSPLEVRSHSNGSSTCEGSGQAEPPISPAPLTSIEKIIGSHTTSIYPGSPPHYQQDILHRRLYLEEEFVHLSAGSFSVVSSDSDTSCSNDDSCRSDVSISEVDCFLSQDSIKFGIADHSNASPHEDNYHEEHGQTCLNEKNKYSSDYCGRSKYLSPDKSNISGHDSVHDYSLDENGHAVRQAVSSTKNLKGKNKPKRRTALIMENFAICNTEAANQISNEMFGKADVNRKMDPGCFHNQKKPGCIENYASDSCEKANMLLTHTWKVKGSPTTYGHNSLVKTKSGSGNSSQDDIIRDLFNAEVADSRASETCEELVKCGCIYQVGSDYQESEVALLRSSRNNLCILVFEADVDGQGVIFKILGCHRLKDVKEVVVGLGLQALRVCIEDEATTYLFLPRTVQKFNDLLCLLQVYDSTSLANGYSLRSWEQVQVQLLEKCVRRSLKMGIFLYSMLLFCHDRGGGELWLRRSLFVIEGHLLVCCENLSEFGLPAIHFEASSSYYSLDSCCLIENISEMVVELHDKRCLTLRMNHIIYGNNPFMDMIKKRRQPVDKKQVLTWKLKWFSEDAMEKFVSLLKAIYSGLTSSPLPVKCKS